MLSFNTLPDDKFKTSKLKELADDNFRFDENGRKLSKRVENTVGKGEIARYEQFLHFPQCFHKACFPEASKGVIVWEWVKPMYNVYSVEWSVNTKQEHSYVGWLVVLGFNATLTAKVISWRSVTHRCFLAVPHQY